MPGEFMVEVVEPGGLKHHVGPFKLRQEAEDWIAQNPSDSIATDTRAVEPFLHLKNSRRRAVE